MPKYTAFDIANYFLYKTKEDNQELLSNLKLQKLLYYAQGIHLAMFDKPLFDEKIEAWTYGPVVPDVYHFYKKNGNKGISPSKTFRPSSIDTKTKDFLDEIYTVFGQFSAIRLMQISHTDQCWKDTKANKTIACKAMQNDLRKYLKDG